MGTKQSTKGVLKKEVFYSSNVNASYNVRSNVNASYNVLDQGICKSTII